MGWFIFECLVACHARPHTLSLNLHSRLHSFVALSWDVQYLIWKEEKKDWKTRLTSFDLFLFASNDLKLSFRSSAFLSPKEEKSEMLKNAAELNPTSARANTKK